MTKTNTFTVPLVYRLNARHAAGIEAVAQKFQSNIPQGNHSRRTEVDTKSVLALISGGVALGGECELVFERSDGQITTVETSNTCSMPMFFERVA